MSKLIILLVVLATFFGLHLYISNKDSDRSFNTHKAATENKSPTINSLDDQIASVDLLVAKRLKAKRSLRRLVSDLDLALLNLGRVNSSSAREQVKAVLEQLKTMPELFPEGSLSKDSRAKNTIWSDWQLFDQLLSKSQMVAEELLESLGNTDENQGHSPDSDVTDGFANNGSFNENSSFPVNPGVADRVTGFAGPPPPNNSIVMGGAGSFSTNIGNHLPGTVMHSGKMMAPLGATTLHLVRLKGLCSECHSIFVE